MKVLFLAPQPFFRIRGTPINIRNVVTALAEAGHRVDLLCYPFGEDLEIPGVRIHRVRRPPAVRDVKVGPSLAKIPLDLLMFLHAFGLVRREGYDVIHAVEESVFFAGWLAGMAGARLVYDMDSCISDQLQYTGFVTLAPVIGLVRHLEKRAMCRADVVLTVCKRLSDEVRRRCPSARVVQIEDAPIQASFQDDIEGARRLREELGLGDEPAVVYTGNFESYQGVELLIRAARLVHEREPAVRFVLAGGEPEQVERMRAVASDLDLGDVCIFAGKRPMNEMAAFMTAATVLVSPRIRGENTALKIYTYMQSGRPIVATRLDTHTQVLDQDCAILVNPQAGDLAAGILRGIREPLLAAALGREAVARVAARYSLASFKHKVREVYRVLEEGERGAVRN